MLIKIIKHLRRVIGRCLFDLVCCFTPPGGGHSIKRVCVRLQGAHVGPNVKFSSGLYLHRAENVFFEANSHVGLFFRVIDVSKVVIGMNGLISANVTIISGNHHTDVQKTPIDGMVFIGQNVWIGTGVSIVGPSKIGDNVIIGAHSFVKSDFDSNSVVGGSPAKLIRTLNANNK